jgi:hypothetical protein
MELLKGTYGWFSLSRIVRTTKRGNTMTRYRIREIARDRGTAYALTVAQACMNKSLIALVQKMISDEAVARDLLARVRRRRLAEEAAAKKCEVALKTGLFNPVAVYRKVGRRVVFSHYVEGGRRASLRQTAAALANLPMMRPIGRGVPSDVPAAHIIGNLTPAEMWRGGRPFFPPVERGQTDASREKLSRDAS